MSRAERRRMERAQKKGNMRDPRTDPQGLQEAIGGAVKEALFKKNLADEIDRKLWDKYYQKAAKEASDNSYYILLASVALAIHDFQPRWGCDAIALRLSKIMQYVDLFSKEYDGDLAAYLKRVEDETGLVIEVDSR